LLHLIDGGLTFGIRRLELKFLDKHPFGVSEISLLSSLWEQASLIRVVIFVDVHGHIYVVIQAFLDVL